MLYIVSTPIGNLKDITLRALDVLKEVDLIAAEDTRHSQKLLDHYLIKTPLTSLHDHNERQKHHQLIQKIQSGQSVALISDAGTPLISDPGYQFVLAAREANIKVLTVPGCSALIAALSISGLPSDAFSFYGFLAAKSVARKKVLESLLHNRETLIFYESPHRIIHCLEDMKEVLGEKRFVVLARELTKTYETVHGDTLDNLLQWIREDENQQRGEFVVLVRGDEAEQDQSLQEAITVYKILKEELPMKQAVKLAAKITNVKKNELYTAALAASGLED
jgi:16S rRNA (cytidine1402-2'-O)-methyltransferase